MFDLFLGLRRPVRADGWRFLALASTVSAM
jgi:hypothetical protein